MRFAWLRVMARQQVIENQQGARVSLCKDLLRTITLEEDRLIGTSSGTMLRQRYRLVVQVVSGLLICPVSRLEQRLRSCISWRSAHLAIFLVKLILSMKI